MEVLVRLRRLRRGLISEPAGSGDCRLSFESPMNRWLREPRRMCAVSMGCMTSEGISGEPAWMLLRSKSCAPQRGKSKNSRERARSSPADVIDVTADTPGLDRDACQFNIEHTHDEDEVRYIVAGRGCAIHPQQGPVVASEVETRLDSRSARDLHWFDLCGDRRIRDIVVPGPGWLDAALHQHAVVDRIIDQFAWVQIHPPQTVRSSPACRGTTNLKSASLWTSRARQHCNLCLIKPLSLTRA